MFVGSDLPFWLAVEQSAGGVEVHHLLVDQGTVPVVGVLPGSVPEETAADGFLDPHRSRSAGHHVQLVSEEDFTLFKLVYLFLNSQHILEQLRLIEVKYSATLLLRVCHAFRYLYILIPMVMYTAISPSIKQSVGFHTCP